MRRRVLIGCMIAVAMLALAACGGGSDAKTASASSAGAASALETTTVEAGAVTVKIDPVRLDASGAEFKVSFDTHSVELSLDVARSSTLTVGAGQWSGASWSGDGPSGHHREGTLRFASGGPAQGDVVLTIGGLPAPVTATWTLGG